MTDIRQRLRATGAALAFCTAAVTPPAFSQESASPLIPTQAGWEVTLAPYVYHYRSDPQHKNAFLVGLERHRADNWLWGAAYFSNSFGQDSGTAYVGYVWNNVFYEPALYIKLVAGIMYGYVDPYEDKVPLNHNGWSPMIVPTVGWRFTPHDALQLSMLGSAGLMFSYSRRF